MNEWLQQQDRRKKANLRFGPLISSQIKYNVLCSLNPLIHLSQLHHLGPTSSAILYNQCSLLPSLSLSLYQPCSIIYSAGPSQLSSVPYSSLDYSADLLQPSDTTQHSTKSTTVLRCTTLSSNTIVAPPLSGAAPPNILD